MPDERVARFYDGATRGFLRFGHGRSESVLHRAVWGPGVRSRTEALHYVHELILDRLRRTSAEAVVDLGCGVGGSILYLSERHQAEYLGITVSGYQSQLARRLLRSDAADIRIVHGDMLDLPGFIECKPHRTCCYAVESVIHLENPGPMFDAASEALNSGDLLLICDDMRAESVSERDRFTIERFVAGWNASGLVSAGELRRLAAEAGFACELDLDLTECLELGRPRDVLIRLLQPLLRRLARRFAWCSSMVGGDALQRALKRRAITYRFISFRKL